VLPLQTFETAIRLGFGENTEEVLSVFPCREDCAKEGISEEACECADYADKWLSSWSWGCNFRKSIETLKSDRYDVLYLRNLRNMDF